MVNDLETRQDLEQLLSKFYDSLLADAEMNRIFNDVAQIDMQKHLPTIVDFWEQVVFQTGDYKKNVMKIHLELNEQAKLTPDHFKTWLKTFENTVDENFSGENAEKIKTRALSIATIMQVKLGSFRL